MKHIPVKFSSKDVYIIKQKTALFMEIHTNTDDIPNITYYSPRWSPR